MENKNWPDKVRLKMIEKSEFYPEDKQVYQYGFYDGYQYAQQQQPQPEQGSKPVYDETYLDECIKKATPNLSKIKDVNKALDEIRGVEPEINLRDELINYTVWFRNEHPAEMDFIIKIVDRYLKQKGE